MPRNVTDEIRYGLGFAVTHDLEPVDPLDPLWLRVARQRGYVDASGQPVPRSVNRGNSRTKTPKICPLGHFYKTRHCVACWRQARSVR
jgi:hypothetical protein